MKILDAIVLFLLFFLLTAGIFLFLMNFQSETIDFKSYQATYSTLPTESAQFYPNMRYVESTISYYLSPACTPQKKENFIGGILFLEEKTVLNFYEAKNKEAEIKVECSNLAPEPEQKGHFVAGEGGPTRIVNTSVFSVILEGKISLYREDECPKPQIAIHELLHALGFNHNNNTKSIMYPVTNCGQMLDDYIIKEINTLYQIPSEGDLLIESANANKTGIYINFKAIVANSGMKDIRTSKLKVYSKDSLLKEFDIGELKFGAKKQIEVSNLRTLKSVESISLVVETQEQELSKTNNAVEIRSA